MQLKYKISAADVDLEFLRSLKYQCPKQKQNCTMLQFSYLIVVIGLEVYKTQYSKTIIIVWDVETDKLAEFESAHPDHPKTGYWKMDLKTTSDNCKVKVKLFAIADYRFVLEFAASVPPAIARRAVRWQILCCPLNCITLTPNYAY
jgi:hypothetical protein